MAENVNIQVLDNVEAVNVSVKEGASGGVTSYNDLTDKPTTISVQQANDIVANNAKISFEEAFTIRIDDTNEILSPSLEQTITLTGINLDQITSISLTDSSVIDVVNDINVITDNLIELTITMNSTDGLKDLIVNGFTYSNWIDCKINAGFTYLGSNSGFTMNLGITDAAEIEVNTLAHPCTQELDYIRTNATNNTDYTHFIKMNNFSVSKGDVLDIVVAQVRLDGNSDVFMLGLVENDADVSNTTSYGRSSIKLGFDGFKDINIAQANTITIYGVNESIFANVPISMGQLDITKPLFVRYEFKDDVINIYQLEDIDDKVGSFVNCLHISGNMRLDITKNYVPYINLRERTSTLFALVALRVKN